MTRDTNRLLFNLQGGLMSQNWQPLYPLLKPHPDKVVRDEQIDMDGLTMARYANDYFVNLGFQSLDDEFFDQSIFEKEPGEPCDISAWDLKNDTYRISICTKKTRTDLRQMLDLMCKFYF